MKISELVIGAVVGAGLMYLFDPHVGLRRRSILHDHLAEASTCAATKLGHTRANFNDLCYDVAADLRLEDGTTPGDDALCERVRAALERKITYARSIQVEVADGRAILRGPVMAYDLLPALSAARAVPGVSSVDSQLDVHYTPANSPDFIAANARTPALL